MAGLGLLFATCSTVISTCRSEQTITAKDMPPAPPPPPAEPPLPPAPAFPTSVPKGTWATFPKPGDGMADTPANRTNYFLQVALEVPGEPKINPKAARPLLEKLRAEMAKQGSIPLSAITVGVGDSAGSIKVAKGSKARLKNGDDVVEFGACSEAMFATSMLTAGVTHEVFAKAGVRAVVCNSDGCSGIMDMRPTAPGGGVYGGDACLSMEQMLNKALGKE